MSTVTEIGNEREIRDAVERVNNAQKYVLSGKIAQRFRIDLADERFALWGLAFEPNTDDMREAVSRDVISDLLARGATSMALRYNYYGSREEGS